MNNLEQQESNLRIIVALVAIVVAVIFIAVFSLVLQPVAVEDMEAGTLYFGDVFFDRSNGLYPLTIQNLMWLLFAVGVGELKIRFERGKQEALQLKAGLLPEDDSTMLRARELVPIFNGINQAKLFQDLFLQRLVRRVILQFQNSKSIDQSNTLMNSSLEMMQHEIEMKYNMLRYLVWLIPTVGFIGTVVGIGLALSEAASMPDLGQSDAIRVWMGVLTTKLGIAFNTTLLALIMSAILVFLMQIAQGREETTLNGCGQYCLDNLINRLYEEKN